MEGYPVTHHISQDCQLQSPLCSTSGPTFPNCTESKDSSKNFLLKKALTSYSVSSKNPSIPRCQGYGIPSTPSVYYKKKACVIPVLHTDCYQRGKKKKKELNQMHSINPRQNILLVKFTHTQKKGNKKQLSSDIESL